MRARRKDTVRFDRCEYCDAILNVEVSRPDASDHTLRTPTVTRPSSPIRAFSDMFGGHPSSSEEQVETEDARLVGDRTALDDETLEDSDDDRHPDSTRKLRDILRWQDDGGTIYADGQPIVASGP